MIRSMKQRPVTAAMAALLLFMGSLTGWADEPPSPAEDLFVLEITGAQTVATPVPLVIPAWQYQQLSADATLSVGPVEVVGALSLQNDGRYGEPNPGFWAGFSTTLDAGGISLDLDPFSLHAGRFTHDDVVSSPYSLFVSSRPIPTLLLDFSIETDRFFYDTRWLGLNRKSRLPGVDDRGANIRTYGVRFNALRVGVQDSLVYADRQFDLEYFLSPVPGTFLQYAKVAAGTPWSEVGNDNSILGLFADYSVPAFYAYGQLLVDDFNANAILNPDSYQNPNKIAWSLGGALPTRYGEFGFYHAGATKYTFEAFGGGSVGSATDTKYGYTYYPAVEYTLDGGTRVIVPEDNYIGYLHGENNVAFLLTYSTTINPVRIDASLEYTLSGPKSPANPWHEWNAWDEPEGIVDGVSGTRFLDGDYLESRLTVTGHAEATFGIWTLFAEPMVGFVANELQLTAVPAELSGPNNVIRYFAPNPASDRWYGGITLGGSVRLPLR